MPRDLVLEHLEILRMSRYELDRRVRDESDDYLLWAAATRYRLLGCEEKFNDLAVLVAASDRDHPALNYESIELLSAIPTGLMRSRHELVGKIFQAQVRMGHLPVAWEQARFEAYQNEQRGLEMFVEIWQARPSILWSIAAMADAFLEIEPSRALPYLRQAVAAAEAGASRPHPKLPDRPCGVDVLAGYLDELQAAADDSQALLKRLERLDRDPISSDHSRELNVLKRSCRTAERRLHEDLSVLDGPERAVRLAHHAMDWQALEERWVVLLDGILNEDPDDLETRSGRALLSGTRRVGERQQLLWIVPDAALRATCHLALTQVAAEVSPRSHAVAEGTWGGWTALLLEVDGDDNELPDLTGMVLDEVQGDLDAPLSPVTIDWRWLELLAGKDERDTLLARLAAVEGSSAVEAPAAVAADRPDVLRKFLRRVLLRLIRLHKIGAAHTELGHFFSGLPTSDRGAMKDLLDILIHDGYVRLKPTLKEPHISLEPTRLPALWRFIQEDVVPEGRLGQYFEATAAGI